MTMQQKNRRITAVKLADAVNQIEGVPVSPQAKRLSSRWAKGEISGAEMKAALIAAHKRPLSDAKHA